MNKKKEFDVNPDGLIGKIYAMFGFYLEGITILFLFLPGILYQVNFLGSDISQYNGLSIILFLAISFYYSLPFIVAGIFIRMTEEGKRGFDKNKYSAFAIGVFAIGTYFTSIVLPSWLFVIANFIPYIPLSSPEVFTGNTLLDFWGRFVFVTIFFIILTFIDRCLSREVRN
jgi:hypothetical protein